MHSSRTDSSDLEEERFLVGVLLIVLSLSLSSFGVSLVVNLDSPSRGSSRCEASLAVGMVVLMSRLLAISALRRLSFMIRLYIRHVAESYMCIAVIDSWSSSYRGD